jgi:hypothetical protein
MAPETGSIWVSDQKSRPSWSWGFWSLYKLSKAMSNCRVQGPLDVVTQIHVTIEFVQDFPDFLSIPLRRNFSYAFTSILLLERKRQ